MNGLCPSQLHQSYSPYGCHWNFSFKIVLIVVAIFFFFFFLFFLAKGTNIYKIKVKDTETGGTLKPDPAKTKRNTS
jgi:hypothetical protein